MKAKSVTTLRYQVQITGDPQDPRPGERKGRSRSRRQDRGHQGRPAECCPERMALRSLMPSWQNVALTGGTLTVTREKDGQTTAYTFQYKGAEITSSQTVSKPCRDHRGRQGRRGREGDHRDRHRLRHQRHHLLVQGWTRSGTYTASGITQARRHTPLRSPISPKAPV